MTIKLVFYITYLSISVCNSRAHLFSSLSRALVAAAAHFCDGSLFPRHVCVWWWDRAGLEGSIAAFSLAGGGFYA